MLQRAIVLFPLLCMLYRLSLTTYVLYINVISTMPVDFVMKRVREDYPLINRSFAFVVHYVTFVTLWFHLSNNYGFLKHADNTCIYIYIVKIYS